MGFFKKKRSKGGKVIEERYLSDIVTLSSLELPGHHWLPEGEEGLVSTLEHFNRALLEEDPARRLAKIFSAFLALARRYDLYHGLGNEGVGHGGQRFIELLVRNLSSSEKRSLMQLDCVQELTEIPPIVDEAERGRQRDLGEQVFRDLRDNPYRLFNDFKGACRSVRDGGDAEQPFGLLVKLLYLVGKNRAHHLNAPFREETEEQARSTQVIEAVFENLMDYYFLGSGSYRIIIYSFLKEDPVLGNDVTYVRAEVNGYFYEVGADRNFVYDRELESQATMVAIIPRPFDMSRCDLRIAELRGTGYKRQLMPVSVNGIEMIAYMYVIAEAG